MTELKLSQLKSSLTRAKNTKNPDKILAECSRAFAIFDQTYWPDCWSEWERAQRDAIAQKGLSRSWKNCV